LSRLFSILLFLVLTLLLVSGLFWYLAYQLDATPPAEITLSSLQAPIRLEWQQEGAVTVTAATPQDFDAALGFVHGYNDPAMVVLLRQAALGRLSEWFGDSVLVIDRFSRRLQLARLAERSFHLLPEDEQIRLRTYAEGMNAALETPFVRHLDAFTLIGRLPDPWEPWHTLALERLYAWLATPPLSADSLIAAHPALQSFVKEDRVFRTFLQFHGWEHSIAWTLTDDVQTHLYQRHVYGATASPFLQSMDLRTPGGRPLLVASLPGTPYFPAGKSGTHAWAILLSSSRALRPIAAEIKAPVTTYERIVSRNNSEHLVPILRLEEGLVLVEPIAPVPADSLQPGKPGRRGWVLTWPGFSPPSDHLAWHQLPDTPAAPFRLLDGDGLSLRPGERGVVLGSPPVQLTLPGGLFIGQTYWVSWLGARLDSLTRQETAPLNPARISNDTFSLWAASLLAPLTASLDPTTLPTPATQEALTYLRNWDYAYDRTSIAASIFETWMALYRDSTGTLPMGPLTPLPDADRARFGRLFNRAVATLVSNYTTDLSQWRWEAVHPDIRYQIHAPVAADRYTPLTLPGRGHPSTLTWGPSPVSSGPASPSTWESWTSGAAEAPFFVRSHQFDTHRFLGRYLIDTEPVILRLPVLPERSRPTTLLLPSNR